jgi:hypothetical protein
MVLLHMSQLPPRPIDKFKRSIMTTRLAVDKQIARTKKSRDCGFFIMEGFKP